MKELSKEIIKDLEELFDFAKTSNRKDTFCENYLSGLSKKGYEIEGYKDIYFQILKERYQITIYSTVTDFAKFLGLSTSHPRITAIWYANSWIGIDVKIGVKYSEVLGI